MAADSGAGLHAGRTSRSSSSCHGLGEFPSSPVHREREVLWGSNEERLRYEVEDEDGIRLSDIYTGKNTPRIVYEYDFGDGWQHEIILEKILEPEPRVTYPCCLEGARACPPEDVGGIWGYAKFLEAISDPNHADHDEMVEWVGGEFDPEKFSVDEVNKELG